MHIKNDERSIFQEPMLYIMIVLAIYGLIVVYEGSQMIDYDIRSTESCYVLTNYKEMPIKMIFTEISEQELREMIRDNGCLNRDEIMQDYYKSLENDKRR